MKRWMLSIFFIPGMLLGSFQDNEDYNDEPGVPLYVSLGSHCEVAWFMKAFGMRHASFPFDWILTFDHSKTLLLIEEDFREFLNPNCLIANPAIGYVLNTHYSIDFRHDWINPYVVAVGYQDIADKYIRRINRFYGLGHSKSKVFFLRGAFDLNIDPHLPTITSECTRITRSEAEALRETLKRKFPELDFRLIIFNYEEEHTPPIEGLSGVYEFKIRKAARVDDYHNVYDWLKIHAPEL